MPDQDQGEGQDQTESNAVESADETASDNQGDQESSQSNESESVAKQTYRLPDGRELDGEGVLGEYNKLQSEFTRRSQRLSELEKAEAAREAEAKAATDKQIADSDLLSNVEPEVKAAIQQLVQPLISNALKERDLQQEQAQANQAFENELARLEEKYSGKEGLPKFDRNKVLEAMKDPNNRNYDPESKFRELHEDVFTDYYVKAALKKQQGGSDTEDTGRQTTHEPDSKAPTTFQEAAKRFYSRIK